jgi:hypothetical protein
LTWRITLRWRVSNAGARAVPLGHAGQRALPRCRNRLDSRPCHHDDDDARCAHDPAGRWHADHVAFARLPDRFDREAAAFSAAGEPNYELMIDIVRYLRDYLGARIISPRMTQQAFVRLIR